MKPEELQDLQQVFETLIKEDDIRAAMGVKVISQEVVRELFAVVLGDLLPARQRPVVRPTHSNRPWWIDAIGRPPQEQTPPAQNPFQTNETPRDLWRRFLWGDGPFQRQNDGLMEREQAEARRRQEQAQQALDLVRPAFVTEHRMYEQYMRLIDADRQRRLERLREQHRRLALTEAAEVLNGSTDGNGRGSTDDV